MDNLRLPVRGRGPILALGLALGLLTSACGISKPPSVLGSGGASASGTGGAPPAATGGAPGVAGTSGTASGGAPGTAGVGGGGAAGAGAITTGLQYNGVIRFLREVP